MKSLSLEEIKILNESRVAIVGCGGLGGYIAEFLCRIGIEHITIIDGDVFDESNLNRQLVSHTENIGLSKVKETQKRINLVNPNVQVKALDILLDNTNSRDILKGHHVVVDALDNIKTRRIIQNTCRELNIPMVYGAIAGFYGQASTIFPGDNTLDFIYSKNIINEQGIERDLGNPSFIPPLIASIQVAEVIKILINKGELLRNKILFVDLLENSFDIIKIKQLDSLKPL